MEALTALSAVEQLACLASQFRTVVGLTSAAPSPYEVASLPGSETCQPAGKSVALNTALLAAVWSEDWPGVTGP